MDSLSAARGVGTSLITLLVPPGGDQLGKASRLLTEEQGAAANIKSRANRQSVLWAIASAKQRLKACGVRAPENGLVVLCGQVIHRNG